MNPDQQTITKPIRFCAEPVSSEQIALITQIVTHCGGLGNQRKRLLIDPLRADARESLRGDGGR